MATRVLVADDHNVVRQALKLLLEREGFDVVAEAADGIEAVRLARAVQPDVVVLDLMMPGTNGLEAAREIAQSSAKTKAILLTSRTDEEHVLEALRAGVRGCVPKSLEARDLVEAVRVVAAGGIYLPREASGVLVSAYLGGSALPSDPLTPRERQVLQLISEGKRSREIAELLGVSIKTVESHRSRISRKLQIRETAGLVRYALRHGLSAL